VPPLMPPRPPWACPLAWRRPALRAPCLACSSWMSASWEDSRKLRARVSRASWRR
jgi:hypothetical protein